MAQKKYDKKALEALGKLWDDSEDKEAELPDGDYEMIVESCEYYPGDGKKRSSVCTKGVISGGDEDFVGQEATFFDGLENEKQVGWFKRKLRRGKINPGEGAEGFIEALGELVGRKLKIGVKNNEGFCNWYINGLTEADALAELKELKKDGKAKSSADDDDEPDDEDPSGDDDAVDLETFDRAALKEFIKEQKLEITVTKKMSDDDVRAAITEAMGGSEEPDEPDDEPLGDDDEPEGDEPDGDDDSLESKLKALDRAELKQFIKDESIDLVVTKKMTDDDIREKILELNNAGKSSDQDEPEGDDEPSGDDDGAGDRVYPTQEELDGLNAKDIEKQLKAFPTLEVGKLGSATSKKSACKFLVAMIEGDECEPTAELLKSCAAGFGIRIKAGTKDADIESMIADKLKEVLA